MDVTDFSCVYLFIKLIYSLNIGSLFIRQIRDRAWLTALSWPCRDQYPKTSGCSQPGGRGRGAAEQRGRDRGRPRDCCCCLVAKPCPTLL